MNDLFKGLIRAHGNRKYFYEPFDDLNYVKIPTEAMMFQVQLNNLRDLEQSQSTKYKNTNEFLASANARLKGLDGMEDTITNELYARLIQLLNTGLWSNDMNPTRRHAKGLINKDQKVQEIDKIMSEVHTILSRLNLSQGISKSTVDMLEKRLRKQSGKDNNAYTQQKADQAEKIMVEILNQNPVFKALQTGNFVDELGQQLIEDVMAFSKTNNNFGQTLTFRVTKKKSEVGPTLHASSVEDLFNKVAKLSGRHTIHLSVPLYDALKQASVLTTQVKSGANSQPILTKAARNATSFQEIGFCCGRLEELYSVAQSSFKDPALQDSKDLEALANYSLSLAIAKTALNRNQLYYTERGLETASQWMAANNYMLRFNPGVTTMTPEFKTLMRRYQLMKVKG